MRRYLTLKYLGNTRPPAALLSYRPCLILIAMTVFSAGLLFVTGCSREAKSKVAPKLSVPVTAVDAIEENVPETLTAIGSAEPYNMVSIRARIGGALTKVAFAEGQDVRQGDLLFAIDPRSYQAALDAALSALARDKAQAANAEAEARRNSELIKEEYVTRQQYEQALTNAEALKHTVKSDEAAVENARLNLQYCNVLAPISGRTGNLLVHEGDQIKSDDIAMVVINQITPIKVSFSVPEQSLPAIRKYAAAGSLKVEVSFPNDSAKPIQGNLSFIQNTVDASTRTIFLKAAFPNTDKRLWPGQFVNVILTLTTRPHVVVIPSQAIQTGLQGPFVYMVKPDLTAESRSIVPGAETKGQTIIEKGLRTGEKVVTDGQLRLIPGLKVRIQPTLRPGDSKG
jgi:multidrug efflux system membrane fusion protein